MKKIIALSTLLILLLSACSATSRSQFSNSGTGSVPATTQFIIGVMKLDGTKNQITAKQAGDLIPMWEVYKDISVSDSAAPEEIEGLTEQIQETLTDPQAQAIKDMSLTQRDVFTTMQEQGIITAGNSSSARGNGNGNGNTTQGNNSRNGNGNGGGNFFFAGGGGFPGGSGGFPGGNGGQNLNPSAIATRQAQRGANGTGFASRTPSALIDAFIKYLQKKAGV